MRDKDLKYIAGTYSGNANRDRGGRRRVAEGELKEANAASFYWSMTSRFPPIHARRIRDRDTGHFTKDEETDLYRYFRTF